MYRDFNRDPFYHPPGFYPSRQSLVHDSIGSHLHAVGMCLINSRAEPMPHAHAGGQGEGRKRFDFWEEEGQGMLWEACRTEGEDGPEGLYVEEVRAYLKAAAEPSTPIARSRTENSGGNAVRGAVPRRPVKPLPQKEIIPIRPRPTVPVNFRPASSSSSPSLTYIPTPPP